MRDINKLKQRTYFGLLQTRQGITVYRLRTKYRFKFTFELEVRFGQSGMGLGKF